MSELKNTSDSEEIRGCANPIMFYADALHTLVIFTSTGMHQIEPGQLMRLSSPGQPMLTVKDDYEDHAAAIRNMKQCMKGIRLMRAKVDVSEGMLVTANEVEVIAK